MFYFPHNMDFRGRTYPIPPHLNHLGQDLCRGLLIFAEGKPLGPSGLRWYVVVIFPALNPSFSRIAFVLSQAESAFGQRVWQRQDSL